MKLWAMALGIDLVQFKQGRAVMTFLPGKSLDPRLCAHLVETFEGRVLFKSSEPFSLTLAHGDAAQDVTQARELLRVGYFYDKKDPSPSREHPAGST